MKLMNATILFLSLIPVVSSALDPLAPSFGSMKSSRSASRLMRASNANRASQNSNSENQLHSISLHDLQRLQISDTAGEARQKEWYQAKGYLNAIERFSEISAENTADDIEVTFWVIDEAEKLADKCVPNNLDLKSQINTIRANINAQINRINQAQNN